MKSLVICIYKKVTLKYTSTYVRITEARLRIGGTGTGQNLRQFLRGQLHRSRGLISGQGC